MSEGKRDKKSSTKASPFVSKMLKFKHENPKRKECAKLVIVESDEEELENISVQKDVVEKEKVVASKEISFDVDRVLELTG